MTIKNVYTLLLLIEDKSITNFSGTNAFLLYAFHTDSELKRHLKAKYANINKSIVDYYLNNPVNIEKETFYLYLIDKSKEFINVLAFISDLSLITFENERLKLNINGINFVNNCNELTTIRNEYKTFAKKFNLDYAYIIERLV